MEDAKQLWTQWQELLSAFAPAFTVPGWARFAQWVTGMVLCDEQHTITQSVTSLSLQEQWRNWERLAEYGAWDQRQVERGLLELTEREGAARFAGYRPVAVDDTKALRWSREAWGVCTFQHAGRNANRPKLVRGHNWVVMGDLSPGDPWTYRPLGGRLYLRQSQLPQGEVFRSKLALAVEMLQQADAASGAPVLAVVDGGYARKNMGHPCLGSIRPIQVLTRPRGDARLYRALPPKPVAKPRTRRKRRGGRPRKWGQRLPSPRSHARWGAKWQKGAAYIYGRRRKFRGKRLDGRWAVTGPDVPVAVFVFEVEGYEAPWYLVTTAVELSAKQVVEAYAARFRQEDGIRDHKQRLGMEEVRAWTKNPVLRTFQVQVVALTLLRLLGQRLAHRGISWLTAPPWNPHKRGVSILDLRRLLWRHRREFSQFVRDLDEVQKPHRAAG